MKTAAVHQVARKLHRWLSLIVGIQLFLWTLSGLFMASNSIEHVRSEHLQRSPESLDPREVAFDLSLRSKLAELGNLKRLQLVTIAGSPHWLATPLSNATPAALFDARNGKKVSPLETEKIQEIASRDYSGTGELSGLQLAETAVSSDFRGPFPVWIATFSEPTSYRVYIDPNSGQILARRSRLWRTYDWLWMLHIMDYEEHENFNNWFLVVASAFALATSITGLFLLFFVFRRSDFPFFSRS